MNEPAVIDARGMKCPYPVVELARAAKELPGGARVELLADDPVALTDVPAWCRMRGAQLLDVAEEADHWRFVVVTARSERR